VTWTWRYEDAQGQQLPKPPAEATFGTKGDAESWLGETWRDLLDGGVQNVVLLQGDRIEYTMPLTPADS
jgi:hypothetical protein